MIEAPSLEDRMLLPTSPSRMCVVYQPCYHDIKIIILTVKSYLLLPQKIVKISWAFVHISKQNSGFTAMFSINMYHFAKVLETKQE